MYVLIEFSAGETMEAVVLSMDGKRARVAVSGFPDTLELRRAGPDWVTEAGQKVTFAFLLSKGPEAAPLALPVPALAARAAGSYAI